MHKCRACLPSAASLTNTVSAGKKIVGVDATIQRRRLSRRFLDPWANYPIHLLMESLPHPRRDFSKPVRSVERKGRRLSSSVA